MRLDDNLSKKSSAYGTSSAKAVDGASSQAKSRTGSKSDSRDSVTVSDLGNLLTQLRGQGGLDRADVVSRFAEQYRSGQYVVDNASLGEALLAGAFEG